MAFKLASLFVEISARDTTLPTFTGVHKALQDLSRQMESLQQNMKAMFVGLAGAFAGVEYQFMGFESAMHRLAGVAEATDEEFLALSERAKELGRSTVYGAAAVARAMTEFALQGFNAKETYDAIPEVLRLGTIGMMDLADATRIASGVMRGMGLSVGQLHHVVDILASTAAKSATDVSLLGESFKAFGPLALLTHSSIDDVSASLGILANNMIRGQAAGTALRNLYQRMLAPTTAVRKTLDALNVSVTDEHGKMKPLSVIIDELNAAMKGMNDEARAFHISNLAGLRSMTALTVLLQNGGQAVRDFAADLNKSGDYAKKVAALQNATLSSAFRRLTNHASELAIRLGELLLPTMRAIIDVAHNLINSFAELSNKASRGAVELLAMATAMTGLIIVGTAITKAFFALTSPLGLTIAILGLIAGVFLEVGVEGDNLGEKITNLSKTIGDFLKRHQSGFKNFFETIVIGYAFIEESIKNFGQTLDMVMAAGMYAIEKFAVDTAHFFVNVLPAAGAYWVEVFGSNVEYFFGTVIPAYLDFFIQNWKDIWADVVEITGYAFNNLYDNFSSFFNGLFDFIQGGFTGTFQFVWKDMLDGFKRTTKQMPAIAAREIGALETQLKDAFDKSWARAETDTERRNREMAEHLGKQLSGSAIKRAAELIRGLYGLDEIKKKTPVLVGKPGLPRPGPEVGEEGIGSRGKNTFIGIDELAKKIQLAAVGGDVPAQQLAEQKKGNELLKNVNKGINDVGKKLDKGVGLRFVP